ncbi:hypothetical protein JOE43_001136 [Frigoribacterium sp. PvP121]|nr:hypothetical protein [Frigoribacterium sp. PvP121]
MPVAPGSTVTVSGAEIHVPASVDGLSEGSMEKRPASVK